MAAAAAADELAPCAEADVPAAAAAAPNKLGAPAAAADPPEGSREGMSGAWALPPEPDPEAPPSPPAAAAAPFCPWLLLSEDDMLKSSFSRLKRRPEDLPPDVAAVSVESRLVPGCGPASPNSSAEAADVVETGGRSDCLRLCRLLAPESEPSPAPPGPPPPPCAPDEDASSSLGRELSGSLGPAPALAWPDPFPPPLPPPCWPDLEPLAFRMLAAILISV